MKKIHTLITSVFLTTLVLSQIAHSADNKTTKETLAGSLQYDFLIGDWDIQVSKYYVPKGGLKKQKTAWQHVEYRDNGKMIVDEWTGYDADSKEKDSYGITLRTYSEELQQWQNVYMGANQEGGTSSFVSEWKDDEMHGWGQYEVPELGTINYELKFFNITKDSFEWEEKLSKDGGKNWFLNLRQVAKRRLKK